MWNSKGLTLTELLVASFLIGIVMVGVAGFGVSLKKIQDDSGNASVHILQTAAAMKTLIKHAEEITGDEQNPGVVKPEDGPPGPPFQKICFRRDLNAPPTPADYTDDSWSCFRHGGGRIIRYCEDHIGNPPLTGPPDIGPLNPANCQGSPRHELLKVTNTRKFAEIIEDAQGKILFIQFYIETSASPDDFCDVATNPCTSLEARINPYPHSRQ